MNYWVHHFVLKTMDYLCYISGGSLCGFGLLNSTVCIQYVPFSTSLPKITQNAEDLIKH